MQRTVQFGQGAAAAPRSATTKILALIDALGNLVRFLPPLAHRYDTVGVAPLIADIEFGALIADRYAG